MSTPSDHCYACTAPLHNPEFRGASDIYCKYCSDAAGNLKSREQVREGIAHWLMSWGPRISHETALARAEHLMSGLPAWAED